jgi:hypothetical protein
MKKWGCLVVVGFLSFTPFSSYSSISHAECQLPREIAGVRLGDSKEAVLAKCDTLEEEKPDEGMDIPSMQLQYVAGRCSLDGVSFGIKLVFARNKLFKIGCQIIDTSIGMAMSEKLRKDYDGCSIQCPSQHPSKSYLESGSCYADTDTYWEITPVIRVRGSMSWSRIDIEDVPTITECRTALEKGKDDKMNKKQKIGEDLIK